MGSFGEIFGIAAAMLGIMTLVAAIKVIRDDQENMENALRALTRNRVGEAEAQLAEMERRRAAP